jgi:hypothetical protein
MPMTRPGNSPCSSPGAVFRPVCVERERKRERERGNERESERARARGRFLDLRGICKGVDEDVDSAVVARHCGCTRLDVIVRV